MPLIKHKGMLEKVHVFHSHVTFCLIPFYSDLFICGLKQLEIKGAVVTERRRPRCSCNWLELESLGKVI